MFGLDFSTSMQRPCLLARHRSHTHTHTHTCHGWFHPLPVLHVQRFGTESAFKRTILDMIANDLLQRHKVMQHSQQQTQQQQELLQDPGKQQQQQGGNARRSSLSRRPSGYGWADYCWCLDHETGDSSFHHFLTFSTLFPTAGFH